MNGPKINNEELYKLINSVIKDDEKTKNLFIKCFDPVVYEKLSFHYNIKDFLKYLKDTGKAYWKEYLNRINLIIKSNVIDYKEKIGRELSLLSRDRMMYTVDTLLKYTKKILDIDMYQRLEVELRNLTNFNINFTTENIKNIVQLITGRKYEYFLTRHTQYVNKKYIQHIFNKWKAPKFVIKPGVIEEEGVGIPQGIQTKIGDEKLQKIQQMVNKIQMKLLNNDRNILASLLPTEYNNDNLKYGLFSFWENNMFKYLKKNNLRPRNRDAILQATVWVYLKKMNYVVKIEDFVSDPKDIPYVTTIYNKLSPIYFMVDTNYEEILDNIRGHIDKLSNKEILISQIREEFKKFNPKTKKDKEDIIYKILKPYKILKKDIRTLI